MELLMEVKVQVENGYSCEGHRMNIVMLPFTAVATGRYFQGETLGQCVDTQKIIPGKAGFLSARYLLQGKDYTGAECKIFIENNGDDWSHLNPTIITDSEALKSWEEDLIYDTAQICEGGVIIRFYRE